MPAIKKHKTTRKQLCLRKAKDIVRFHNSKLNHFKRDTAIQNVGALLNSLVLRDPVFFHSYRQIVKKSGLSMKVVRKWMPVLKAYGIIKVQQEHKFHHFRANEAPVYALDLCFWRSMRAARTRRSFSYTKKAQGHTRLALSVNKNRHVMPNTSSYSYQNKNWKDKNFKTLDLNTINGTKVRDGYKVFAQRLLKSKMHKKRQLYFTNKLIRAEHKENLRRKLKEIDAKIALEINMPHKNDLDLELELTAEIEKLTEADKSRLLPASRNTKLIAPALRAIKSVEPEERKINYEKMHIEELIKISNKSPYCLKQLFVEPQCLINYDKVKINEYEPVEHEEQIQKPDFNDIDNWKPVDFLNYIKAREYNGWKCLITFSRDEFRIIKMLKNQLTDWVRKLRKIEDYNCDNHDLKDYIDWVLFYRRWSDISLYEFTARMKIWKYIMRFFKPYEKVPSLNTCVRTGQALIGIKTYGIMDYYYTSKNKNGVKKTLEIMKKALMYMTKKDLVTTVRNLVGCGPYTLDKKFNVNYLIQDALAQHKVKDAMFDYNAKLFRDDEYLAQRMKRMHIEQFGED